MSKIGVLIEKMCPKGVAYKSIGEVLDVFNGYAFDSSFFNTEQNGIPLIRIRDVNSGFSNTYFDGKFDEKYVVNDGELLIGMDGDFRINRWAHGRALLNQRVCRLQNFRGVLDSWVFHFMHEQLIRIQASSDSGTVNHLSSKQIAEIKVPVPPIEVQQEIVKILDTFTEFEAELEAELEARKAQYLHYSESALFTNIDEGSEKMKLADVCDLQNGYAFKSQEMKDAEADGLMPILRISNLGSGGGIVGDFKFHSPVGIGDRFIASENDVVVAMTGATLGKVAVVEKGSFLLNQRVGMFRNDKSKIDLKYLSFILRSQVFYNYCQNAIGLSAQGNISKDQLLDFEFSLPSLQSQEQITDFLEKFESLVLGANSLLPIELKARRQQYEYYRNKLLTFKELEVA